MPNSISQFIGFLCLVSLLRILMPENFDYFFYFGGKADIFLNSNGSFVLAQAHNKYVRLFSVRFGVPG